MFWVYHRFGKVNKARISKSCLKVNKKIKNVGKTRDCNKWHCWKMTGWQPLRMLVFPERMRAKLPSLSCNSTLEVIGNTSKKKWLWQTVNDNKGKLKRKENGTKTAINWDLKSVKCITSIKTYLISLSKASTITKLKNRFSKASQKAYSIVGKKQKKINILSEPQKEKSSNLFVFTGRLFLFGVLIKNLKYYQSFHLI